MPARAPGSEEPRLVLDDVVHDGVLQLPHGVVLQVVQLGGRQVQVGPRVPGVSGSPDSPSRDRPW